MATDIRAVLDNLTRFYEFHDRTVLHVGAGGGQLIGYAGRCKQVLAIDRDPRAIEMLRERLVDEEWVHRVAVIEADLSEVDREADLVFLEFCLHEMDDPEAALRHSLRLAPEVLVFDHDPQSRWAWFTAESEKAARGWAAVDALGPVRSEVFSGTQLFADADDLRKCLYVLGPEVAARSEEMRGVSPVEIPMSYRAALLGRPRGA